MDKEWIDDIFQKADKENKRKGIKFLPYYLDISKNVKKFISKLDKNLKERVNKELSILPVKPLPSNKNHILSLNGDKMLCEKSIDKLRFYYIIYDARVIISDVIYKGKLKIEEAFSSHKSGNKNYPNQRNDITKIKKKYGFREEKENYLSKKKIEDLWNMLETQEYIRINPHGNKPTKKDFEKTMKK